MGYDVVADMLAKITKLAVQRQQPFIILENPRFVADKAANPHNPMGWTDPYLATIGNAAMSFDGFYEVEMIELYAGLKGQLEAQDERARLYVHAKSP